MNNIDIITKFYSAFTEGNSEAMIECYHDDIIFEDPAFGRLEGKRAKAMWQMLLSQKTSEVNVTYNNIESENSTGQASWVARYNYGLQKRKVTNKVSANFKFKDGKIIHHKDSFDLWAWSRQALGAAGYLLGWTPFMRKKIQKTTGARLDKYMRK